MVWLATSNGISPVRSDARALNDEPAQHVGRRGKRQRRDAIQPAIGLPCPQKCQRDERRGQDMWQDLHAGFRRGPAMPGAVGGDQRGLTLVADTVRSIVICPTATPKRRNACRNVSNVAPASPRSRVQKFSGKCPTLQKVDAAVDLVHVPVLTPHVELEPEVDIHPESRCRPDRLKC